MYYDEHDGYQTVTGLQAFMFPLGAVFALTAGDAYALAREFGMAGGDSEAEYDQLITDYLASSPLPVRVV